MTFDPYVDLPADDPLADVIRRVAILTEAGAVVSFYTGPLDPGVLGYLGQEVPDGPMVVNWDPTKTPEQQLKCLDDAFEVIFGGLEVDWTFEDVPYGDTGALMTVRKHEMRAE
ncbi:hypothetical protein [Cellulomonas sp. P24]|uniref:hypothetical protein n=1 Tax=Cellulomonas sp. P24 TaxID=2885206 RepID=UPI00216B06F0|nr:hypothetical protein [Cellulomonas sp. P24]MCR6491714.1 hypothetical protein [Cellulomonas sp. P24]